MLQLKLNSTFISDVTLTNNKTHRTMSDFNFHIYFIDLLENYK